MSPISVNICKRDLVKVLMMAITIFELDSKIVYVDGVDDILGNKC